MRTSDELSLSGPATDRDASTTTSADLDEADRLISDLTALVDAGLIEIRQHVLGPARYGAVSRRNAPHRPTRHSARLCPT